jgi:hypothetical protein
MNENIKKFYRICVFGTEENNEKAAANRAYRDMCRTIRFEKGVSQMRKNDCRTRVVELIETEIKNCNSIDTLEKYDEFHDSLCLRIIDCYDNQTIAEITYGQAQKWVNMTMKYLCVLYEGQCDWLNKIYSFLHIPIDSIILDKAKKEFQNEFSVNNTPWSQLSREEYITIQNKLRAVIKDVALIDWEFKAWNR